MNTSEKIKLIEGLHDYDHAFLTQEGADHFAVPFGLTLKCRRHVADGDVNPKGLTLKDGSRSAVGIDAMILACRIADHLGVTYPEKFGRGSQLHAAVDATLDHLRKETDHS